MTSGLLREIQAAAYLGYTEISDFRRDLKKGTIPEPTRYLGGNKGRPLWSVAILAAWAEQKENAAPFADFTTRTASFR
jgi:hypothetical protein